MDFINSSQIPIITAFLIGFFTSIHPCQLAANITAIAFMSKDITNSKKIFLNSLSYTLGRAFVYTVLVFVIIYGLSTIEISHMLEEWSEILLGPILIIIGFLLLDILKIDIHGKSNISERIKTWLKTKGYIGSFILGCILALAFCPYSAVMFFGLLISLAFTSDIPLLLSSSFSLGISIPVILFSFLLAFSVQRIGKVFESLKKIEKYVAKIIGITFIIVGIYYIIHMFLESH